MRLGSILTQAFQSFAKIVKSLFSGRTASNKKTKTLGRFRKALAASTGEKPLKFKPKSLFKRIVSVKTQKQQLKQQTCTAMGDRFFKEMTDNPYPPEEGFEKVTHQFFRDMKGMQMLSGDKPINKEGMSDAEIKTAINTFQAEQNLTDGELFLVSQFMNQGPIVGFTEHLQAPIKEKLGAELHSNNPARSISCEKVNGKLLIKYSYDQKVENLLSGADVYQMKSPKTFKLDFVVELSPIVDSSAPEALITPDGMPFVLSVPPQAYQLKSDLDSINMDKLSKM